MRLKMASMKALLSIFPLLVSMAAFAQQSCSDPSKNIAVFFGNGIQTDQNSAQASLKLLKNELGTAYNGQTIRYDLAYNATSGLAADLGQSVLQAQIQWDSQISGWLNRIGVSPDWFTAWYKKFLLSATTVVASELTDHVNAYRNAILSGQKVVVVAHSQGNFYVNEAKKLLALELTAAEIKSFGIYSVANPANNVGGEGAPYLTNSNDIIQLVPGSLSPNWILRTASGTTVDSIGLTSVSILAHLFNETYISPDYDLKPTLLGGIKAQLANTVQPTGNCDNYRKYFVGQFAGTYSGTCNMQAKQVITITPDAQLIFPNVALDLSQSATTVSVVQLVTPKLATDKPLINLKAIFSSTIPASLNGTDATWFSDTFSSAGRIVNSAVETSCTRYAADPITSLSKPVDLTKSVTNLLLRYRTSFPKGACVSTINGQTSASLSNQVASFTGEAMVLGNRLINLTSGRYIEAVQLQPATPNQLDFDPNILLTVIYLNGDEAQLSYSKYRGLNLLNYVSNSRANTLTCTR